MRKIYIIIFAFLLVSQQMVFADEELSTILIPIRESSSRSVTTDNSSFGGKEIMVRLYNNWQSEPRSYTLLGIQFSDLQDNLDHIKSSITDFDEAAILAIVKEDQTDNTIADAMDGIVYTCDFQSEDAITDFKLLLSQDKQATKTKQFVDALGGSIPNASIEIFLNDYSENSPQIYIGKTVTDEKGCITIFEARGKLNSFSFIISSPDYGKAICSPQFNSGYTIVAPLLSKNSEEFQRSIWGKVIDSEGNPISEAVIRCSNARTLGEGLINSTYGKSYESLTDENGMFSFYLPNEKRIEDRGYLIPPKSKYDVRIEAPKELGLTPYIEPIENGRETTITLDNAYYLRILTFQDANGLTIDPSKLLYIHLSVTLDDGSRLNYSYNDFINESAFPLGQYQATMSILEDYEFEPLTVDANSPEELIFKPRESLLYHGQVVHGLTGRPMSGAFVMGFQSSGGNFSTISDQQWDLLHTLPAEPSLDNPALEPLNQMYGIKDIVRTDENGHFKIWLRPGEAYGFIAFEKNYLGIEYDCFYLTTDENNIVNMPAFKLYPAATVCIYLSAETGHISIWPRWVIDKNDNPTWVNEFLAIDNNKESEFTYDSWLEINELQTFHVPAGLNVSIKLDTPYDEQWCPIEIPRIFNLSQGQVIDLGNYTFQPALEVLVEVLDSQGQTIEGVPVKTLKEELQDDGRVRRSWGLTHNTDEAGIARFYVAPYSEGKFGVMYDGRSGPFQYETIQYQVNGYEDTEMKFIMILSDEIIRMLFENPIDL